MANRINRRNRTNVERYVELLATLEVTQAEKIQLAHDKALLEERLRILGENYDALARGHFALGESHQKLEAEHEKLRSRYDMIVDACGVARDADVAAKKE